MSDGNKVYCGTCKHYDEGSYVAETLYEYQNCAIKEAKRLDIPGNYRDAPRSEIVFLLPSEKNINNDCEDWEKR